MKITQSKYFVNYTQASTFFLICFFFSGATGLTYEVVWTRILNLIFGHTTFAVSTILSAFMGGLAIGSYIIGQWLDNQYEKHKQSQKQLSLIHIYAILEGGIALSALFSLPAFKFIEIIFINIMADFSPPFYIMSLIRFVLCFIVLLIPTTLMGGTLPVISKFLIQNPIDKKSKFALIYAVNTFGAVIGTVATGFFLLPKLGITYTIWIAVIINTVICAFFLSIKRVDIKSGLNITGTEENAKPYSRTLTLDSRLLITIAFLTGAASMLFQIGWTRTLSLAIGSSVYAFTTILTIFLLGIAVGSFIMRFLPSNKFSIKFNLGGILLLLGISAIAVHPLIGELPYFVVRFFKIVAPSFTSALLLNFLFSFAVVFIPTLFMGMALPQLVHIFTEDIHEFAKGIGIIYSANTIGAICGSFITGFILVPVFGLEITLKIGILIYILTGIFFWVTSAIQQKTPFLLPVSTLLVLLLYWLTFLYLPKWNKAQLSIGPAIRPQSLQGKSKRAFLSQSGQIIYYKDGINSTVTVHRFGTHNHELLTVKVNGKPDASTSNENQAEQTDMPTQYLLGYLPLFYHPKPENVAVIGLGSGVTAGSAAQVPDVKRIDCIEIEPAMLEASRFFDKYNHNALSNPKVNAIINDGRTFLLSAKKKYDVIISEPSNPWIAGIANLFSDDFYKIAVSKLSENGIMCQWLQFYALDPKDFRMILATFFKNFPHGSIWLGKNGDTILLGSRHKLQFNYERVEQLMKNIPSIKSDMENIQIFSPFALLSHYIGEKDIFTKLFHTAKINTDNKPLLEFSAPKYLYERENYQMINYHGLFSMKNTWWPVLINTPKDIEDNIDQLYMTALALRSNGEPTRAVQLLELILLKNSNHEKSLLLLAEISYTSNAYNRAKTLLEAALKINKNNPKIHRLLGHIFNSTGEIVPAIIELRKAKALGDTDINLYHTLGNILIKQRKYNEAENLYKEAVIIHPNSSTIVFELARTYIITNQNSAAIEYYKKGLELNPESQEAYIGIGNAYFKENDFNMALDAYNTASNINPELIEAHINRGACLVALSKNNEALKAFQKALELDPYNKNALHNISLLVTSP